MNISGNQIRDESDYDYIRKQSNRKANMKSLNQSPSLLFKWSNYWKAIQSINKFLQRDQIIDLNFLW